MTTRVYFDTGAQLYFIDQSELPCDLQAGSKVHLPCGNYRVVSAGISPQHYRVTTITAGHPPAVRTGSDKLFDLLQDAYPNQSQKVTSLLSLAMNIGKTSVSPGGIQLPSSALGQFDDVIYVELAATAAKQPKKPTILKGVPPVVLALRPNSADKRKLSKRSVRRGRTKN